MKEPKCTLTDAELTERCSEWISKLCKTGGQAWTLKVPVDFNQDPDMLFSELIKRFKKIGIAIEALKEIQNWDDELDDEYGDPGYRAAMALKELT